MTQLATINAWRANGASLHTYKYAIETVTGMDSIPQRRHRQQRVANVHGIVPYFDAMFDAGRIDLTFWLLGQDADGNVTHPDGPAGHRQQNLDEIKGLFGVKGSPVALERDVYIAGGTVTRTIDAQVSAYIPIVGSSGMRRLTVRLDTWWPFWSDAVQQVSRVGDGALTPTIGGNAPMAYAIIDLDGDREMRVALNGTSQYVEFNGIVPVGGARINTRDRTCVAISGGADLSDEIRVGTSEWLELAQGTTPTLDCTGFVGGGSFTFNWFDSWQ